MEKFAPEFHGEDANNKATKFLESIKGKFASSKDPKKKDSIISVNSIDIEVTKESPITSGTNIINPTSEADSAPETKANYPRKPLVSFKEDLTPSDNPFSKLYKETIETFDNNEEESSYSYEEINDQTNDNITARLDRIDEKLSEILGMLHTLVVASAGPTSARDGIRDAMVGLREEMIEKIRAEALMTNDRLEAMARLRNEESEKMAKDTSDEVSLNPTSKKLSDLLEDNDSDNDLSLDDF
uniref:Phosphoprotein n=1 Tax=Human respiratory syncytial virus TaxID=11250 RepID=A0A0B5HBW0_HRSV|nr:phosphoprotein [Human orthopneumovirus]ASZ84927.1 phosphoprotein [Human orthopneumovirus]QTC33413.1 phosphoprotein [Human orthopneumovirus]QTC33908.1 phosphoprotein [Human orthopneumovirus]QTC33919.1 phosphoprotein [Human orthopneumovirus]